MGIKLVVSAALVPSCRKPISAPVGRISSTAAGLVSKGRFIWLHKIKELDSVGLAHVWLLCFQQQIKTLLYRVNGS